MTRGCRGKVTLAGVGASLTPSFGGTSNISLSLPSTQDIQIPKVFLFFLSLQPIPVPQLTPGAKTRFYQRGDGQQASHLESRGKVVFRQKA